MYKSFASQLQIWLGGTAQSPGGGGGGGVVFLK